jgi:YVTN family beta-propeller protein
MILTFFYNFAFTMKHNSLINIGFIAIIFLNYFTATSAQVVARITSVQPVECYGDNSGYAQVSVTGGSPPFTFLWSPSGGSEKNSKGLIAGDYTVTVTDRNGSTIGLKTRITQPPSQLSASITSVTHAFSFNANNGIATAKGEGGTPPYTYKWPSGVSSDHLSAGTYTCTVIDNNNCMTTVSVTITQPSTPSHYKIANRILVEGNGGWDYLTVDEKNNLLYVSHGTMVQVVDLNKQKVTASIPANGVHGIALAPEFNKGYISDGKDTAVTVFDLKSFAILKKIKVTGNNPDAIIYEEKSKRVFTFNGKSDNSTVIDAATDKVLSTISVDGKPEFSVSDEKGNIFFNLEDKNSIEELDDKNMKVSGKWSIEPGDSPSGLAIDKKNSILFSVCDNKFMVIWDADKGTTITTLPIGERPDGVAFDPGLKRAYSANGDGTLTIVQEEKGNKFSVLETLPTQKGARTIAVNTKTHHIYLPVAEVGPSTPKTADNPKPKPNYVPGSFVILDIVPLD